MTEFPDTRDTLLADIRSPENRQAWEEFCLLYRPVIYRMARRRQMQDADAQDVTQNVLARIAGAIGRYEAHPGTRFRHWLRRVAKNAILTALSKTTPDAPIGGSVANDILAEQPGDESAASRELEKEYLREQFLRAAAIVRTDVNAETWQAFELTVIQGMSCEEAASSTGKSTGTVYAARSRIMKRLRNQIELMQSRDDNE